MSRERRLRKDLLALMLLALCPMPAIAQDEVWVRVDVFDGRASVEVPKSYKRADGDSLDHLREMVSGRDGFYKEGMCEAWISTFGETRRNCALPISFGSSDSRAHFWVLELRPKRGMDDRAWLNTFYDLCPEDRNMINRKKGSTVFAYNDRSRGLTYCGGIGGAATWLVCKRTGGGRICVDGMDYVEVIKASRWRSNTSHGKHLALKQSQDGIDAKAVWNTYRRQANGPVIERVLESFRYK